MRPEEIKDISKEKFTLVNENKKLKDKELVTKPVGFFMDAMHRFGKNKGSIVGAIVIGLLVLFAIVVPWFSNYTVSYNDTYYKFTLPKVFDSEKVDFLDGGTNKTLNQYSFLYYYSMGVETGHNSVKRQEYSRNTTSEMYTFRLDTYQQHGTVFMTLPQDEYNELQKYQDDHNIQIIYPITDPTQRPAATQDNSNGNYWYKTEADGTITKPVDYTINDDGTITYTNIYLPYSIPAMDSTSSADDKAIVSLVENGGGYSLFVTELLKTKDEEGNDVSTKSAVGYVKVYAKDNSNYTEIVDNLSDASVFTYDSTLNTVVVAISGHKDNSQNGDYVFGLPKASGSTVTLYKKDTYNPDETILFNFYLDGEMVAIPVAGQEYYFAANRVSYEDVMYFVGLDADTITVTTARGSSKAMRFEAKDGGYVVKIKQLGSTYTYVRAFADGDKTSYVVNEIDEDKATVFTASGSNLYAVVNGHTTASLDGEYYFGADMTGTKAAFSLMTAEEIDSSSKKFALNIVDPTSYDIQTSVVSGQDYKFSIDYLKANDKYFYINGGFKGDNYFSKMRVEGADNLIYSYGIPKSGKRYEVRVNYYEYYCYFHQHVLHDKISRPFFLFGTTAAGQDIFTCLASGARFSFIMAIVVAIVNMVVGAIYGAIEGYYGGRIDLVMERIVEILSAVPFMIVITLLKYHMGGSSHVLILFIAFFLTGWIGESGLVRMQFYRFKNQEYVLAARTLGAKDPRIMFKHIFPNSLGTIVTSSVLVIPGMIFSETSLSYLGIINLNSGTMTSVGTLLANAQPYISVYPHMILFPSIFISLLMLCFNLFGNGLRDAFNPSLRGTED